ncbi:hypothetical protein AOLI_G00306610 [Acnodon oligacanthus]
MRRSRHYKASKFLLLRRLQPLPVTFPALRLEAEYMGAITRSFACIGLARVLTHGPARRPRDSVRSAVASSSGLSSFEIIDL